MKKISIFLLSLLIFLLVVIAVNTLRFSSKQTNQKGERRKFEVDTSAVNHLATAIRFPTISYDQEIVLTATDSLVRAIPKYPVIVPGWHSEMKPISEFDSLNQFLKNTYPLSFKTLSVQTINKHSLLLHWKGASTSKKPVILYAHLDVVPAYSETDTSIWQHEPFGGSVDSKFIYGRGAIDDKGSVIAILESIEKLIGKNFIPSRDIYIAFGHDEESDGDDGAMKIAEVLEKEGVKAEFLLDEGGLVAIDMVPFVKAPVALVFTSEKGYLTIELSVKNNGGHSSFPPADPPVEILSKAIQKVHDHPFEKRMSESVSDFMDYVGPEMKFPFNALFANRWLLKPVIFKEYEKIPSGNATIRTTSVTTVIKGGEKENVIPTEVSAKINFRLLPGDSSSAIVRRVKELINDERITIRVLENVTEASNVSSVNSDGFKLLNSVIGKIFPDAVVAPSLLIAQTDSRHFRNVTENIYRFLPVRMDDKILDTMHGKDEKIGIDDFMESIEFYKLLISSL